MLLLNCWLIIIHNPNTFTRLNLLFFLSFGWMAWYCWALLSLDQSCQLILLYSICTFKTPGMTSQMVLKQLDCIKTSTLYLTSYLKAISFNPIWGNLTRVSVVIFNWCWQAGSQRDRDRALVITQRNEMSLLIAWPLHLCRSWGILRNTIMILQTFNILMQWCMFRFGFIGYITCLHYFTVPLLSLRHLEKI